MSQSAYVPHRRPCRLRGLLMGLAGAVALASPGAAAELVISNWDAYMAPDVGERFQAATGHTIDLAVHASNEEIMGKLMAAGGRGYDLVFVSTQFAEVLNAQGLLAPIDPAKIPNLANLYPEARQLPHDPGNAFSVPYTWGTTGLCYRSDLLEAEPTSWKDLLDPPAAAEGKTTMLATDRWLMGAGLLATGASVNERDPDKIAQARDALIAAKPQLLAYDDTTFYSKLVSGEAVLAHAWDGWCNYGITENADIKFVVPQEGSDLWIDTMVILKSSENIDAAHEFINFILDAETHRWTAENILYKVPNQAAMEALDPAMTEKYPNMGWTLAERMGDLELLRDLGEAQRDHARAVSQVMAAQ